MALHHMAFIQLFYHCWLVSRDTKVPVISLTDDPGEDASTLRCLVPHPLDILLDQVLPRLMKVPVGLRNGRTSVLESSEHPAVSPFDVLTLFTTDLLVASRLVGSRETAIEG
jgi:hypothetical protein